MQNKKVFGKYKNDKQYQKYYGEAEQMLNLAIQISELRKKKGLTQKQLAQKTGMPQSQIARIESGNSNVTMETIYKITTVLNKKLQIA